MLHDGERQGGLIVLPGETRAFEWAIRAGEGRGDHQEAIAIESNAKNAPEGGYVIIVRYKGN